MTRIVFSVTSVYAPELGPYVGTFETDRLKHHEILDQIFVRGGNQPDPQEHFPGWSQPSVSVGDMIHFRIADEGTSVFYSFIVDHHGWHELEEEFMDSAGARMILSRFEEVDDEFALQRAQMRDRRDALMAKRHLTAMGIRRPEQIDETCVRHALGEFNS